MRLKVDACSRSLVTLGPIGHLPMPGTWGTLCAVPLVFLVKFIAGYTAHPVVCEWLFWGLCAIVAAPLITYVEKKVNQIDPGCIVLDEVIGYAIACFALPASLKMFFVTFILFRFLDITKIAGISFFEDIPGGWGIILDDVAAGFITNVIVWVYFLLF